LVAKPELAEKLSDRVVANTNIMAIEAGKAALADEEFYQFSLQKNQEAKQLMISALDDLNLNYLPSHANFIFFHANRDAREIAKQMLDRNVIVGRPFPPLNDWCRVSTGTPDEMRLFNKALKEIYS
jgi:histidinol-phosphate/aromatic aminotransferase/cobyric acid decarboxylase-like protein